MRVNKSGCFVCLCTSIGGLIIPLFEITVRTIKYVIDKELFTLLSKLTFRRLTKLCSSTMLIGLRRVPRIGWFVNRDFHEVVNTLLLANLAEYGIDW